MSSAATAVTAAKLFRGLNLAFELYSAGHLIAGKLIERQQRRESEGREITDADVDALMNEGDVKDKVEKAQLALAKLAQMQSGPAAAG